MATIGKILLEKNGVFIDEAEINNADGSHLKIKLTKNRLLVRVLNRGSKNQPSSTFKLVPFGHPVPRYHSEATLLMLPPTYQGKSSVSVQVIVTWSFTLLVTVRVRDMVGDLTEEFAQKRSRLSKLKAIIWLINQSLNSIAPLVWQIARYDTHAGLAAWRTWRTSRRK